MRCTTFLFHSTHARLAQLVEHQTFNLRAMGLSPMSGVIYSGNSTLKNNNSQCLDTQKNR